MDELQKDKALSLLQNIMDMETVNPPGGELPLAQFSAAYLQNTRAEVEVEDLGGGRGNIISRISGGKGKSLILCGHLDTVPYGDESNWEYPPGRFTLVGNKVYGRGSSDMKGGFAAMLYAFREFCDCKEKPKGDIILLGTADEESQGLGARALLLKVDFSRAACVVIGEPTKNHIALASKGVLWLTFQILGKSSHGAYPERGVNAAEISFEFISCVKNLCEGIPHALLTKPTCTLSSIRAGVKVNVVPDFCEITLDVRTTPGVSHEVLLKKIDEVSREFCDRFRRISIRRHILTDRGAVETDEKNEIAQELLKIRNRVIKEPHYFIGTAYFSDASIFAEHVPVPTLLFGPGIPGNAHTPNEFLEAGDYFDAIECYRQLIDAYYL